MEPVKRVSSLDDKRNEKQKVVYVKTGFGAFIGVAKYGVVKDEEGIDEEVVIEMEDAVEVVLASSDQGPAMICVQLGKIVVLPEECIIAELTNKSAMYVQYVQATTGIQLAGNTGGKAN
jgi:hypothetical protein